MLTNTKLNPGVFTRTLPTHLGLAGFCFLSARAAVVKQTVVTMQQQTDTNAAFKTTEL